MVCADARARDRKEPQVHHGKTNFSIQARPCFETLGDVACVEQCKNTFCLKNFNIYNFLKIYQSPHCISIECQMIVVHLRIYLFVVFPDIASSLLLYVSDFMTCELFCDCLVPLTHTYTLKNYKCLKMFYVLLGIFFF